MLRWAFRWRWAVAVAVSAAAPHCVNGYCNGMRWPPRTSKAFPPGWNGLAATPPRGWRSWYAYYTNYDQGMIEDVIDALTAKNRTVSGWDGQVSLCDLGYCAAGLDEGWEGCGLGVNGTQHYVNGTPAINPQRFPDMKGLVAYGHSKGVKMGFYYNGCGCMERREPASGWDVDYVGDVRALGDLGFDAVKFDGCGRLCNLTRYAQLMNESGKRFEIENCHWGDCTGDDASSCPTQEWCPFNWFRTSGDSNNALGTWFNNLQTTVRFQSWDSPVSRPGCWAYPDMLQVGRLGCPSASTHGCPVPASLAGWTRAHFAAFCIASSPLVLSIHPSDANLEPLLDIVGNKRAIEVNQAWAGHPGTLVKTLPPAAAPPPPVAAGPHVVAVPCDPSDATQSGWVYDAVARAVRQGGLCLSTDGWTLPLMLEACGNKSTFQNFTYDHVTRHFTSVAPTNKPTPLPCCLQAGHPPGAGVPGKVDVYRCESTPSFQFDVVGGTIRSGGTNATCLAGRDSYNPPPPGVAGVQIWAKPLPQGRVAVLFINGGALAHPGANVSLADVNATGATVATDVWSHGDGGPVESGAWRTGAVPPLDARFVVLGRG